MKRYGQKLLVLVLALPLILFLGLQSRFFTEYWQAKRTPEKFILPAGYLGWVAVEYGNSACPALMEKDGFRTGTIGAVGEFCTSSELPKGWGEDVYAYADAPGVNLLDNPKAGMNRIWYEHAESPGGKKTYYVFYVGDRLMEDELKEELKKLHERLASRIE